MSCSDKVQRCSTTCELGRINALIKSGQCASMLHGEGEKVEGGEVRGSREVWEGMGISEGKVVGPHFVRAVGCEVFLRSDFPAKGVLHHGFEGGFPLGSQRFGRDQQVVRQIKRGFHDMGDNIGIWLNIKLRESLECRVSPETCDTFRLRFFRDRPKKSFALTFLLVWGQMLFGHDATSKGTNCLSLRLTIPDATFISISAW